MADATPQAPTTPAGDAAAGRDEVVEQAAEFIWDYIHGNWGAYEDVQEMAAGLAERGLLATPPTGDPIFKETAETLNTAAGNASQLEQATPDTELRERYARAIARAMWGAAVNRCDPMPIDWSAADAVMAERDTENARLNGKLGEALGEAQRLREQLAEREKLPRVWQECYPEPSGVREVIDRSGYRRWCRSTADGTWYMRDIAGPVLTWSDLVELNGPVTEVRAALTAERQRE